MLLHGVPPRKASSAAHHARVSLLLLEDATQDSAICCAHFVNVIANVNFIRGPQPLLSTVTEIGTDRERGQEQTKNSVKNGNISNKNKPVAGAVSLDNKVPRMES